MRARRAGWAVRMVSLALVAGACGSGGGSPTAPTRSATAQLRLSEVPPTVTGITLTVSGEGMTPLQVPIPVAAGAGIIELSPGHRTFQVTVHAKGKVFSGSTTQLIEAGRDNLVEVRIALNEPPSVRVVADRVVTTAGRGIRLTCTASDPDGEPVAFSWRTSDGALSTVAGPTTIWTGAAGQEATVTCTATDPRGAGASASLQVRVQDPPTAPPVPVPVPPLLSTLSVTVGGAGLGSVSAPGISCSNFGATDCAETYPVGTSVLLTATPQPPSTFTGWTGGGCSGTGTCTIILGGDTSVTAVFAP